MHKERTLQRTEATDSKFLPWQIISLAEAAGLNPYVNAFDPPAITPYLYDSGGYAVHRLAAFVRAAAAGELFRFRIWGWKKPKELDALFGQATRHLPSTGAAPAAPTNRELGWSYGRKLGDVTVACSHGPISDAVPIESAPDAGGLWWKASAQNAVAWKYAAKGFEPLPDPGEAWVGLAAANEVQTITMTATGGTWTYSFRGASTAALAFDITTAALQTAIRALSTVNGAHVNVTGTAGSSYVVTFVGKLAGQDLPMAVLGIGSLTGGDATIAETTKGDPGAELEYKIDTLGDWLLMAQPLSMGAATKCLLAMCPFY